MYAIIGRKMSIKRTVLLYHGGPDEIDGDTLDGPVFLTPRKDVAESYGERVYEVYVDTSELLIDLDMGGALLLSVEEANGYLNNDGWTIDDYLDRGQSVGVMRDVGVIR